MSCHVCIRVAEGCRIAFFSLCVVRSISQEMCVLAYKRVSRMLFSLQYLKAKAVMQLIQGVFLLFQLSLMLL